METGLSAAYSWLKAIAAGRLSVRLLQGQPSGTGLLAVGLSFQLKPWLVESHRDGRDKTALELEVLNRRETSIADLAFIIGGSVLLTLGILDVKMLGKVDPLSQNNIALQLVVDLDKQCTAQLALVSQKFVVSCNLMSDVIG